MHSNLTPFLARQRQTDLHEQAARYRTGHPDRPDPQPDARPVNRRVSLWRVATRPVHRRRTA